MKELSIEEKAKRYDGALEKARQLCAYPTSKPFISDLQDLFPELKESGDERIKSEIIKFIYGGYSQRWLLDETKQAWIAWLEKQSEHANFRNKIQIGDKVTRNEDGVLVNLSQLNRVAKPAEKQGEQKPVDKVEPKFKVGDWVVCKAAPKLTAFKTGDVVQISNKETLKFMNYSSMSEGGDIFIEKGLHCYSTKCKVEGCSDEFGHTVVYVHYLTPSSVISLPPQSYRSSALYTPKLMKCIIPKGTVYYENTHGEIVSEKLIIKYEENNE